MSSSLFGFAKLPAELKELIYEHNGNADECKYESAKSQKTNCNSAIANMMWSDQAQYEIELPKIQREIGNIRAQISGTNNNDARQSLYDQISVLDKKVKQIKGNAIVLPTDQIKRNINNYKNE